MLQQVLIIHIFLTDMISIPNTTGDQKASICLNEEFLIKTMPT